MVADFELLSGRQHELKGSNFIIFNRLQARFFVFTVLFAYHM